MAPVSTAAETCWFEAGFSSREESGLVTVCLGLVPVGSTWSPWEDEPNPITAVSIPVHFLRVFSRAGVIRGFPEF